jgi:hypothetical protein
MQIPTSAGMLANSVLPVTPTMGGLSSPVGETAGSTSFAPVEAVSNISLSRTLPEQGQQPVAAPENSTYSDIAARGNENSVNKTDTREEGQQQRSEQDGSTPIQAQSNKNSEQSENVSKQQDLELVRSLSQRESEVHAHENAHSAVGGQYAGSANFIYQRGPDGVNYAVGGEVPIDVGVIPGNPGATLEKMLLVQRAALAPTEPSSQDRKVATLAAQLANQARAELVIESRSSSNSDETSATDSADKTDKAQNSESSPAPRDAKISNINDAQLANDRIAKINEILVAISQNDTSKATGQLLDAVV